MVYTVMVYASIPTSKHLDENHSTFNEDLFCHLSRPSSLYSPPGLLPSLLYTRQPYPGTHGTVATGTIFSSRSFSLQD